MHINPNQFAFAVGVAVAGTGFAIGDVTHHRTRIATDFTAICFY
jgi:hypothetical protein